MPTSPVIHGEFTIVHGCGFVARGRTQGYANQSLLRHSCAAEQQRQERAERLEARRAAEGPIRDCVCPTVTHKHGTPEAYTSDRCRCRPCKNAHASAAARRSRLRAYGRLENVRVDSTEARAHMATLLAQGMTLKAIAARSGVAYSTIGPIAKGVFREGKRRYPRVIKGTVNKILAVQPSDDLASRRYVPATGTVRRLQALMRIGYSNQALLALAGGGAYLPTIIRQGRVQTATASRVKAAYDRLWDVPPSRATAEDRRTFTKSINIAIAAGYAPPLAWDDEIIDDPEAVPQGMPTGVVDRRGVAAADRIEDTEYLIDQGLGLIEILERFGVSRDGLYKVLLRAGRRDLLERLWGTAIDERSEAA